jgi:hypothetical protein
MAVAERRPKPLQFLRRFAQEFSPSETFFATTQGPEIPLSNSENYRRSRPEMVRRAIAAQHSPDDISPYSVLAEQIVNLALDPVLARHSYHSHSASQNLDAGDQDKGVDVLIADKSNIVVLGIDVKLRQGRSVARRDGGGWSPRLKSPYIYLSLGDWSTLNKSNTTINVKQWLADAVAPNLSNSGKIPHFVSFQSYIIDRLSRSLQSFYHQFICHPNSSTWGFPKAVEDRQILRAKLEILNKFFQTSPLLFDKI